MSRLEAEEVTETETETKRKRRTSMIELLSKRYPELAERIRRIAEQTGMDPDELIASYTNWAIQVREFTGYLTSEDIKKVTPESLLASAKLLMFLQDQYFRILAYSPMQQAIQLYNIIAQAVASAYGYYHPTATATQSQQVVAPPPPPQPAMSERMLSAILRAIELFTGGRSIEEKEEFARMVARFVANELIKAYQQEQVQKQSQAQSQKQ